MSGEPGNDKAGPCASGSPVHGLRTVRCTASTEGGEAAAVPAQSTFRTLPAAASARLLTTDGVTLEARHTPARGADPAPVEDGSRPVAIVLAHGFTGSLDRPAVRRTVRAFAQRAAVISFSFRGHGRSTGRSTVGDREVLDLAAAVGWARGLGYSAVATVGFSMGGSVVLRHAALCRPGRSDATDGTHPAHAGRTEAHSAAHGRATADALVSSLPHAHADAAVAVSAPARWFYRGTAPMRRVHWAIEGPVGRLVARVGLRTRVYHRPWDPVPLSPVAAAGRIAPVPLLVVHGDQDPYFPLDHPRSLAAAGEPRHTELWLEPGFGHAENAAPPALLDRIAGWASRAAATGHRTG